MAEQVPGTSGSYTEKTQDTINALCDWITDKTKNGASSEELAILPEIAKATASLITASKKLVFISVTDCSVKDFVHLTKFFSCTS